MTNQVTTKALADFFSVTDRTIQKWEEKFEEKKLPRARRDRGYYDFLVFILNIYNLQKEEIEMLKSSGDEKLHRLKMDGQRIQNKERDIKFRRLLGSLVDFNRVQAAVADVTLNWRKHILSLIPKITNATDGVVDRSKRIQQIEKEVHKLLVDLADQSNLKINIEEEIETTLEEEEPEGVEENETT